MEMRRRHDADDGEFPPPDERVMAGFGVHVSGFGDSISRLFAAAPNDRFVAARTRRSFHRALAGGTSVLDGFAAGHYHPDRHGHHNGGAFDRFDYEIS